MTVKKLHSTIKTLDREYPLFALVDSAGRTVVQVTDEKLAYTLKEYLQE